MAEWLGTGLQNLLQRFDSAWYLQKCLWTHSSLGKVFHATAMANTLCQELGVIK